MSATQSSSTKFFFRRFQMKFLALSSALATYAASALVGFVYSLTVTIVQQGTVYPRVLR
jgi:hypothetical protein